jgi:hypothetical protein
MLTISRLPRNRPSSRRRLVNSRRIRPPRMLNRLPKTPRRLSKTPPLEVSASTVRFQLLQY